MQRLWIVEHGGNLTGYIARYGSRNDPTHFGNGGEAIFAADHAALVEAERRAVEAERRAVELAGRREARLYARCPECERSNGPNYVGRCNH
jgi:hypothetical protein